MPNDNPYDLGPAGESDFGLHDQPNPNDIRPDQGKTVRGGATIEELAARGLRLETVMTHGVDGQEMSPYDVGPGVRQLSLAAFNDPSLAQDPQLRSILRDKSVSIMIGDEDDDVRGEMMTRGHMGGRGPSPSSVVPTVELPAGRGVTQPRSLARVAPAPLRPDAGQVLHRAGPDTEGMSPEEARTAMKEAARSGRALSAESIAMAVSGYAPAGQAPSLPEHRPVAQSHITGGYEDEGDYYEEDEEYDPNPDLPNLEDLPVAEEFDESAPTPAPTPKPARKPRRAAPPVRRRPVAASPPPHPTVDPEALTMEYLLWDNHRLRKIIEQLSDQLGTNPSQHEPGLEAYELDASGRHEWARLIQIVMGETVEGRRLHLVMVDGTKISASGFNAAVDRNKGSFNFQVTMEKDLFAPPKPEPPEADDEQEPED